MQTKRIQCPQCGIVLDVKNSKNESVKLITCPSCHTTLQIKFEPQKEPLEAHTYCAPKASNNLCGLTELATPNKTQDSACLIYEGYTYHLEMGDNVIGRKGNSSRASIQIATTDRYMSRQHCRINVSSLPDKSLKAVLCDYQNKNMTSVNGQTIGLGDEIRLMDGDKITMGETTLTFKLS